MGYWYPNKEYGLCPNELKSVAASSPESIAEYKEALLKMLILNLDPLKKCNCPTVLTHK